MNPTFWGAFFAAGIFAGMLICLEIGHRLGMSRLEKDSELSRAGVGQVNAALFALLGLLLAFTFSGAATRFDARRQLVIQEANHIATAYLRIEVLPERFRPELKQMFRDYLDSRLASYAKLPDIAAAQLELDRSIQLQNKIWTYTVAACRESGIAQSYMIMLAPLNQMIDISATRTEITRTHPPKIIFCMLGVLSLAGALLAGYGMAGKFRSWIHIVSFAAIIGVTIYVIFDLEYPRLGLITVEDADQALIKVRKSMD